MSAPGRIMDWVRVDAKTAAKHPLYGVKGFLLFFLIIQVIGVLMAIGSCIDVAASYGLPIDYFLVAGLPESAYAAFLLAWVTALTGYLIAAAYKNEYRFGYKFRAICITAILVAWPISLLGAIVFRFPGSVRIVLETLPGYVFWAAVWIAYFHRSRRVRVTYEHLVERGDALAIRPVSSSSQPTDRDEKNETIHGSGASASTSPDKSPSNEGAGLLSNEQLDLASLDDRLFDLVAKELSVNRRDEGLWLRAYAICDGDESKARAEYIRLRVRKLARTLADSRGSRQES